jgi:hypothetical protein
MRFFFIGCRVNFLLFLKHSFIKNQFFFKQLSFLQKKKTVFPMLQFSHYHSLQENFFFAFRAMSDRKKFHQKIFKRGSC